MKIAWTKVLATVFGALIVALQGVNLHETTGMESHIEQTEDNLLNKIYALEIELGRRGDRNLALMKKIADKVGVEASPSPSPEH